MKHAAALALLVAVLVPGSAIAAGGAVPAEPAKAVVLRCATGAFGMDFTPFKKTDGNIRVTIMVEAPAATGRWQVAALGDGHAASIATLLAGRCDGGCPATRDEKGGYQLWAPAPKALQQLADDEMLTIGVVAPDLKDIKISTFRGRDIVALEKGECSSDAEAASP